MTEQDFNQEHQEPHEQQKQPEAQTQQNKQDKNMEFDAADIEKNKTMAGLAYFIFFLPLVAAPESKFGKFHANQGLLLLILGVAGNIILGMIPILGWFLMLPFGILVLVIGIMGLMNGFGGKAKELPLIGKFRIIK